MAGPRVVGTVHSPAALREALRLRPGAVDALELRVDHFAVDPAVLERAAPRLAFPLIVTVRHPAEGGFGNLSAARRAELYRRFLPHAALIDLEARSLGTGADVRAEAAEAGVGVIVSDHHFRATPSAARLRERLRTMLAARPDVLKIAALTEDAADVARLLALFSAMRGRPLSVMGMGPLGKASRLLFARAGSVLNYGYLGEAQVPGQWRAVILKARLSEVLDEE